MMSEQMDEMDEVPSYLGVQSAHLEDNDWPNYELPPTTLGSQSPPEWPDNDWSTGVLPPTKLKICSSLELQYNELHLTDELHLKLKALSLREVMDNDWPSDELPPPNFEGQSGREEVMDNESAHG
jgi:hypothetical protein